MDAYTLAKQGERLRIQQRIQKLEQDLKLTQYTLNQARLRAHKLDIELGNTHVDPASNGDDTYGLCVGV